MFMYKTTRITSVENRISIKHNGLLVALVMSVCKYEKAYDVKDYV